MQVPGRLRPSLWVAAQGLRGARPALGVIPSPYHSHDLHDNQDLGSEMEGKAPPALQSRGAGLRLLWPRCCRRRLARMKLPPEGRAEGTAEGRAEEPARPWLSSSPG